MAVFELEAQLVPLHILLPRHQRIGRGGGGARRARGGGRPNGGGEIPVGHRAVHPTLPQRRRKRTRPL